MEIYDSHVNQRSKESFGYEVIVKDLGNGHCILNKLSSKTKARPSWRCIQNILPDIHEI